MITMQTNYGNIQIELDLELTPITANNFIEYAKAGFYDGTIFHRVIKDFMIQGGGFDENMQQKKTNDPIQNEADKGRKNLKYTIAMARTSDPHSASSQFFINVADNNFLNFKTPNRDGWGYCVFGKVTGGEEIVDKISKVDTGNKAGHQDVPLTHVIIEKVICEDQA